MSKEDRLLIKETESIKSIKIDNPKYEPEKISNFKIMKYFIMNILSSIKLFFKENKYLYWMIFVGTILLIFSYIALNVIKYIAFEL